MKWFLGMAVLLLAAAGFASIPSPRPVNAFPGSDSLALVGQACDGFGKVTGRFVWQSYNQGDQWLDVSTVNGEFVWRQFLGHGPFTQNQNSTDRGGLSSNTVYFARVNTAVFPFWVPSNTITFQTIACAPSGPQAGSPPQTCDGFGNVTARFTWQPLGEGDHWLDVSTAGSGFEWGTFFGLGPFPPQPTTVDRGGLKPGTVHYVRINAAIFPFWIPSPTFVFQTISCTTPTPTPTSTATNTPVPTSTPTPTSTP